MRPTALATLSASLFGALLFGCAESDYSSKTAEQQDPYAYRSEPESESGDSKTLRSEEGIAAQGYDLVSYFEGSPRVGKARYEATHEGVTYRFRSEENLERFQDDPERYEPAYGGYCAFAVAAKGKLVHPDPRSYSIQDGRLLLFFEGEMNGKRVDAKKIWQENPNQMLVRADQRWPLVASKR